MSCDFCVFLYNYEQKIGTYNLFFERQEKKMSRKQIDVGYSPERIAEMREFFRDNDFSAGISLDHSSEIPDGEEKVFNRSKAFFPQYWLKNLPGLGVKRKMNNFSKDHPVNFIENVDGVHFSEEVARIHSDDELFSEALDRFFEMFREPIMLAFTGYAGSVGKELDDLNEDEIMFVVEKVADVLNEEFIKVLMLGQQVPEIFGVSNVYAAHEDFNRAVPRNRDEINFRNKWTHCKTGLGAPLFFSEVIGDEADENYPGRLAIEAARNFFENGDPEEELEYKLIHDMFAKTLDEEERKIYSFLESGYSQREIAEKLGYKSKTSVSRRLAEIRKKLADFLDSEEE